MNTLNPADLGAMDGVPDIPTLAYVDAADLLARPYTPPAHLVSSLLPSVGTVLFTGDTGAGKTAVTDHIAICIATGIPVAGRFQIADETRPVLILNGEMGSDVLRSYLHQAAAGLGVVIPRGRILFEGEDGVATFHFQSGRESLEALLDKVRPCAMILDTQRALIGVDENDTGAVRVATGWLGRIAETYRMVTILNHHLRKLGPVSNSDRERVAGSRDWIAGVDVHLAAKAREGRPMHALVIGKTRMPTAEAMAGTEWPMELRLELREDPPRSIVVAGEPVRTTDACSVEDAIDEMRARLEAEGPMTILDLGATKGNAKRAYEQLRERGQLIEVDKAGRKTIFGLAGVHEPNERETRTRSEVDRARDRASRNPNGDGRLYAVTARPRSDRDGTSGPDEVSASLSADPSSVPPTAVECNERGQRSALYSDRVRDRVRAPVEIVPEYTA